jgi:hypothetical protein
MTMIDTPDGIAFVKACSRKGALELEMQGMHRSSGQQTAYSIVKQVYGFRGNRKSVLEDLTEYIEAELRLRKLPEPMFKGVVDETQRLIDWLTERSQLDQRHFESVIAENERWGNMQHEQRQAMSDLFYVMIVRQNTAGR